MDRWIDKIYKNIYRQTNQQMRTTEDLIESLVSSCKPMVNNAQSVPGVRITRQTLTLRKNCSTVWHQNTKTKITRASEYKHIRVMVHSKQPMQKPGFAISYWRSKRQNTNLWMAFCCPHPTTVQVYDPNYKNHQDINTYCWWKKSCTS